MKGIFNFFFEHGPKANAARLYGILMARVRAPIFFEAWGLSHTPAAHFAVLTLHIFLVMQRLKKEGRAGAALSRALVEAMVEGLDADLREQGIGDVGVLKRMKVLMQGFYAALEDYEKALAVPDERALYGALDKHLFASLSTDEGRCQHAATYVKTQAAHLLQLGFAALEAGEGLFVEDVK